MVLISLLLSSLLFMIILGPVYMHEWTVRRKERMSQNSFIEKIKFWYLCLLEK